MGLSWLIPAVESVADRQAGKDGDCSVVGIEVLRGLLCNLVQRARLCQNQTLERGFATALAIYGTSGSS